MRRPTSLLLPALSASVLCMAGLAAPTRAQESNTVYLGQVGDTNRLTVDQTGLANTVGGTPDALRLNQIGDGNVATLRQVGEGNGIGGLDMKGRAGFLTGLEGSTSGLFQRGDGNALDIEQRGWRGPGGSLIGAIEQRAAPIAAGATGNQATVRQIGGILADGAGEKTPSSGPGYHTIREILQVWRPSGEPAILGPSTNLLAATQLGFEQRIDQLRQGGAANRIDIGQEGTANALRLLNQDGDDNGARLRMDGERNTLGNAEQVGVFNTIDLRMDGTGNFVDQIVQGGLGGVGVGRGNTVTVSIVGNDNGGDGTGGYRALSAQATVAGAFASSFEQYGEGNSLTLTIGSGTLGRASGNYFSAAQRGIDNKADSLMTGDGNEFALAQDGDGNRLDIVQRSSAIQAPGDSERAGNVALLQQNGVGNLADLSQSGAGNGLTMEIHGDRNQLTSTQTGSANRIDVRIVGSGNLNLAVSGVPTAAKADALAGTISQIGTGHLLAVGIEGDRNVFSSRQAGSRNVATGSIRGTGNWAAIRQSGEHQTLVFGQIGAFNSLFVRQQ